MRLGGSFMLADSSFCLPSHVQPTDHNLAYLRAKQDRMGHLLGLEEPPTGLAN